MPHLWFISRVIINKFWVILFNRMCVALSLCYINKRYSLNVGIIISFIVWRKIPSLRLCNIGHINRQWFIRSFIHINHLRYSQPRSHHTRSLSGLSDRWSLRWLWLSSNFRIHKNILKLICLLSIGINLIIRWEPSCRYLLIKTLVLIMFS